MIVSSHTHNTAPFSVRGFLLCTQLVREAAETLFGLPLQVYVETSGTAGWHIGAGIPSHADNNRDYLSARDLSAVVWLNDGAGRDFEGVLCCACVRACVLSAWRAWPSVGVDCLYGAWLIPRVYA